MKQKLVVFVLALLVLLAVSIGELRQRWAAPLNIPQDGFTLIVEKGDSLRRAANRLHASGILEFPQPIALYGRWTGLDQQIKPGEYLLPQGTTSESLLTLLQRGEVIQYQVTLPEGITLSRAIEILAEQEQLEITVSGQDDDRILEMIEPESHPEGLFFPDTYHYARGDTDLSILERAHAAMQATLEEEWLLRAEGLLYDTPYEALIMASIIERETGLPEERQQISGVFARRLEQGMLLQTDPTVIYGLGESFDGNLKRSHLTEDGNPYNTYRISGLPPTPIALPGRAAIHAALHPEEGSALYFVARGDGGHVFSDTLNEHNRAVRQYQLQRRKNYRSAPEKTP
ncbi:Endolytic murein transglycosylase [Halioglobus japonicus]|nr:Endolytic murein transglycosylase [Halioglobus japonicus]